MNARLKRPLLALVVSSALLAGGAAVASPAYADERDSVTDVATVLDETAPGDEVTPPEQNTPSAEPEDSSSPSPEPSAVPESPAPSNPSSPEPSDTPSETPTPEPSDTPSEDPSPSQSQTPPAPVDTKAPVGTIKLDHYYSWIGQAIVVTQSGVSDDVSTPAQIKRVINWGDGTSSTLAPNQKITKRYSTAKTYTITYTLTDAAKRTKKVTTKAVVTKPGKYKVSAYSLWPGQPVKVTVGSVPSGTYDIDFNWGDGYTGSIGNKGKTFTGMYYHRKNGGLIKGKVTMTARFKNKFGWSSWVYVGQVNVKKDSWKPVVKVTKPSKSTSAKAWKTVKGTVTDKGAGAPYVYVWVSRMVGGKVYCYTPKKTWKRVYSQEQYNNCEGLAVKQSKGKWSIKLSSLPKGGTLYVDAITSDWGDNDSKWASVSAKLSKA